MSDLRADLERRLLQTEGITIARFKETDLICVFYQEKEIAHFQALHVLDMRLTPKIIREKGLSRKSCAIFHPKRSKNSRWICVPFEDQDDIDVLMKLVAHACEARAR